MKQLLQQVIRIAVRAGEEILAVYQRDFAVEHKQDGSPVTLADQRAHALIARELAATAPAIPLLSEESNADVFAQRRQWSRFWLVDPLDGTREFVDRNGDFTVNIALIENQIPLLGVVHTPVQGLTHYAAHGIGAFKSSPGHDAVPIAVRQPTAGRITMVTSRAHAGPEVERFREGVERDFGTVEIAGMGSSLKICLVAEGRADIYPRLGPTSEWDTAAAQCVIETAGGRITDPHGAPLRYNKEHIANPHFIASGGGNCDWTQYCRQ